MNKPTTQQSIKTDTKAKIIQFMQDFSIETTPKSAEKVGDFRDYIKPETWVYVTSLPGVPFSETIKTCKMLANQNMWPVPHFTARSITNKKELGESLTQLTEESGVKKILALAGANKKPAGEFIDSISMLETGLFDKYGIESIGIAGHPEGSIDIDSFSLREHGHKKIRFSEMTNIDMYLITQFVFVAQPVIDWVERIRLEGNNLPVIVGIPGLASLKSLIGHARSCGVGASMKVLTRQARNIHKLLTLQDPSKLIHGLANYSGTHPESKIEGVHMYPLGGLKPTAVWSRAVVNGKFKLNSSGFKIID